MAAPQQLPRDFEDLEFGVIEEHWNEYELQQGFRMIGRAVLVKVMRVPAPPGTEGWGTATQDIFIVTASNLGRGPPSPLTPEEISGQVQVERVPLRIERNNEPWNIYEIPRTGDRLRTRLLVTDVFYVPNRFDKFGYPATIIMSGVMTTHERGTMQPRNV